MSISLALVPVALALTVVLGQNRTKAIVKEKELPCKSSFVSEEDLTVTLEQCGYQAEKWGNRIKTHFRDSENFFFWEKRDGGWHAIFSVYDPAPAVYSLMQEINERSGRMIFAETESVVVPGVHRHEPVQTRAFPTNFRDLALLKQVLLDNGIDAFERDDGSLEVQLADAGLSFAQETLDGPITVEISSEANMQAIYRHLSIIDDEYKRYVQNQVYQHLLTQVEQRGLTIEQEEVLEDHSIVLTINLEE